MILHSKTRFKHCIHLTASEMTTDTQKKQDHSAQNRPHIPQTLSQVDKPLHSSNLRHPTPEEQLWISVYMQHPDPNLYKLQ